MEPEQAFAELGVAPPTTAELLRRAYLKKVKASGPERDPDAFRRIRDAYDSLKDAPWLWSEEFRLLVGRAAATDEAAPAASHTSTELPKDEPANAPATPDASSVPAIDREPGVESERPDVDESEPPVAASAPTTAFTASQRAMEQGDFETAGELLVTALSRSEAPPFSFVVYQVLDCGFRLFQQEEYELARRLLDEFDGWVTRSGIRPTEMPPDGVGRWTILRELAALHGEVDERVMKALVRAVASGNYYEAGSALSRADDAEIAFQARYRKLAPTLYAATQHTFVQVEQEVKRFKAGSWTWAIIVMVGLQLLRVYAEKIGEPSSRPAVESRALVEARSGVEHGPVRVSGNEAEFVLRRQRVIQSASLKECDAVREAWPEYLLQRSEVSNPRMLDNTVEEFRASLLTTCPELADLPVSP